MPPVGFWPVEQQVIGRVTHDNPSVCALALDARQDCTPHRIDSQINPSKQLFPEFF